MPTAEEWERYLVQNAVRRELRQRRYLIETAKRGGPDPRKLDRLTRRYVAEVAAACEDFGRD